MSETLKTIEKRKSTKGFKPEQISDEVLDAILKAGQEAPIGMADFDTMHFTVIQNTELINRISVAATRGTEREGMDIFYGAPTLIIVSSGKQMFPGIDYLNTGGIIQNFLLAATDYELGSVHILGTPAAFVTEPELLKVVGIPEGFKVISSAVIGYPSDEEAEKPKVSRNMGVNKL